MFLHVGCGPKHQAQTPFAAKPWTEIRLDIDPTVKPDVKGTMINMSEVKDQSMDAIFSSHNLEHLYPHEVTLALNEFKRVLKTDGFILLTCPDLTSVCQRVISHGLLEPAYISGMGPIAPLDIMYGHRASMQQGNLFMAHRSGFTQKSLSQTFSASGFYNAVLCRPVHYDLWIVCTLLNKKDKLHELANTFFPSSS